MCCDFFFSWLTLKSVAITMDQGFQSPFPSLKENKRGDSPLWLAIYYVTVLD